MAAMAGHSVDEYLETIYFLAFPIGEYRPQDDGHADALGARRRDARRLARLGRRDAEAARGATGSSSAASTRRRSSPRPAARAPRRRCASTGSSSGCSPTSWATPPPSRTCTRTSSATRSRTTWSSGSTSGSGIPTAARTAGRSTPTLEQAENRELTPLSALAPGDHATIVRLAEHDGELLHWFYDEGFVPGASIELAAAEPAAGQLRVRVDGGEKAIGEKAAAGLFVRLAA